MLRRPAIAGVFLALFAAAWPITAPGQGLISPVHGYVSVEPFEMRKEFVLRFDAVAERLGHSEIEVIDGSNRVELENQLGEWLAGQCPVEADGKPLALELDRVHFVRTDPEKGMVVDERESIAISEALVGAVFATAWDGPPGELRIVWELFPADGSEAIVEAGTRDNRAARKLTPEKPELNWKNEGLALPELLAVPEFSVTSSLRFNWTIGLALGFLGLALASGFLKTGRRKKAAWTVFVAMVAAVAMGTSATSSPVAITTNEEADEICYALLRNIYHAFDYRRESDIYDTLAKSTSGDLLRQIYLEIQRSLQLENQGGARVRISDVDLKRCDLAADPGAEFEAECEWVAVGTVTHWGHTHDRVNKYRAKLTVAPIEKQWRLVDLALESEERIQKLR